MSRALFQWSGGDANRVFLLGLNGIISNLVLNCTKITKIAKCSQLPKGINVLVFFQNWSSSVDSYVACCALTCARIKAQAELVGVRIRAYKTIAIFPSQLAAALEATERHVSQSRF